MHQGGRKTQEHETLSGGPWVSFKSTELHQTVVTRYDVSVGDQYLAAAAADAGVFRHVLRTATPLAPSSEGSCCAMAWKWHSLWPARMPEMLQCTWWRCRYQQQQ